MLYIFLRIIDTQIFDLLHFGMAVKKIDFGICHGRRAEIIGRKKKPLKIWWSLRASYVRKSSLKPVSGFET